MTQYCGLDTIAGIEVEFVGYSSVCHASMASSFAVCTPLFSSAASDMGAELFFACVSISFLLQ